MEKLTFTRLFKAGFVLIGLLFLSATTSSLLANPVYNLFEKVEAPDPGPHPTAEFFEINADAQAQIWAERPLSVTLEGLIYKGQVLDLELRQFQVVTSDFQVRAGESPENAEVIPYEQGIYYRGKVMNDSLTSIVISVFEDDIIGVLMMGSTQYNFGKYGSNPLSSNIYVLAEEQEPGQDVNIGCETLEPDDEGDFKGDDDGHAVELSIEKLVRVYIEVDYDSYNVDFGNSTTAVANYITGIFANVAQLYQAEQINVALSELFIWTSPDPYPTGNSGASLFAFRDYWAAQPAQFNGDLAHLISTRPSTGGVAYLSVLCIPNYQFSTAFSYTFLNYNDYPVYSWSIMVVTHELGHNLDSPHTHNCGEWINGAIDGCGPVAGFPEGNCAPADDFIPSPGGTIMSYCHLNGVGIDFFFGFGYQPGERIRNYVDNASCLQEFQSTGCDPAAEFNYDDDVYCQGGDDPIITITGTSGTFSYEVVSGGPTLDLDASTGDINLANSDLGEYTITNTIGGGPAAELVISGVIDGPLSGGIPKAVEFTAIEDIADLSIFGFGSANNGGGSNGEEFTFPSVALAAGTSIWVASESTGFTNFFGFGPTYTSSAANINGDDAIELFKNGTVIDVFGDINVDGTGQNWEYTDGWAYRKDNTGPDGSNYVFSNWTYSTPNALDGYNTNAEAANPFPIDEYTYEEATNGISCSVTVTISAGAAAEAGENQAVCGNGPVVLAAMGIGEWSGGQGNFSDITDPNAEYTPAASELGSTIALTWTASDPTGQCASSEDIVYITFIPESDAEFMYDGIEFCPNAGELEVTHTTGQPGVFSYTVVNGGPNLDLDTETGTINTGNSDQGTYEVTNTVSGCGNLVITGVIDGPLTGGVPKAIELYALADIPDLSVYGVGSANNGGGSNGEEFSFPADAVTAGTYIYVASETTNFNNFFGFDPDYTSNALLINGDDAMELFCSGQVIDVFGDINVDGTGEPWDYLDGWAYRVDDTGIDGSVFQLDNWFFSGVNALDGETSNATAATPFPIGTYSSASTGVCADAVFTQTVTIEDTEGPELNCPSDIVITLDPGACGAFVTWEVTATDNCDPNPMFEQTLPIDLASGDYFEIGDYTIEYEAEDIYGNTSSCSFVVSILEFPNPTPSLSCNDLVQISLDENGVAIVGADDILEGGPYGCYDDYIVDVLNSFGFSIGNEVDCDDIGTTWGVMVTDPETGNQCWGEIVVEDKLAPEVQCQDYTISCTQDYETLPFPIALDNCDPSPDVQIVDNFVVDNDACDDDIAVVQRTFIAIDEYGNESALCTETITIERPEDVDFPNDIMWECDQYDVYPNITDPADLHPSVAALQTGTDLIDATGISNGTVLANTGSGIPLDLDGQFCGYQYTHADAILDDCGTSFKIVRTWTVLDWCNSTVVTSNQAGEDNVQVIKVVDITGPSVSIAPFEVSANITGQHPMPCTSQDFLPPATITDNCNDWTVRIYTPIGEANYLNGVDGTNGGFIPAPGLELGVYSILYQAEDECGNITELFVTVEVVDDIAPTAICDEITDVNLSSDGLAVVNASVFDDGSYDNCCLEEFLVRRMDGDCEGNFDEFDPTVEFCCSDVAAGEPVMVVFRAVDCFGNANDCMVEVNVNDKLAPILTSCPPNATISCDDYLDNYAAGVEQEDYSVLDGFGSPTWYDNCDLEIDTNVTVNIDACSEGTITRSWTANDAAGNGPVTCTQTITVFHVSDWVVEFPADITVECVDGSLPDFGEPEVFFDECELIGTSFEDVYFYIVPDACYKIERYWTVINWCVYDDFGTDVYEEDGFAECNLFVDWDGDGDQDCRTFRDGWNASGTPGTPDGYIDYKQIIKVIDEDDPEFTIPAIDGCIVDTDCDTDITLPYPDITDECSPEFDVDISGDLGNYDNITLDGITVTDVEVGTYTITYAVTDNCGNTAYQTFDLEVEDCKLPTPYCVNALVIEIMQTGMVEVWAEDFDAGSFDNCGPVTFSFSQDPDDTGIMYTCDDLGEQVVNVWVTDIYGNQDFCETYIFVQDNMGACGNNLVDVSGLIEQENGEAVEDVMVDVNGGLATEMTDQNGSYSFSLLTGEDYTVTPMLDENPGNGVSTYDLVLISRHILNVDPLDSPYKIIAADANKNGFVTTMDMVLIRKVILLLDDEFPNNTSWRFVDADYVFQDPTDPLAENFPEVINYNNLAAEDLYADFVGVKVGDVNGNAQSNANSNSQGRNLEGSYFLNTLDQRLKAGETYTVYLNATEAQLAGFQFTLEFNEQALRLADFEAGLAQEENAGFALVDEGAITISWNEATARNLTAGEQLMGLTFEAQQDGQLSDWLRVSSRYTVAEAYAADGRMLDVQLTFGAATAADGFELYQNVPNPFEGTTVIGFNLPENAEGTLTIMDVSGKVVKFVRGTFAKGYNEIRLSDLDASGVLYYTLETAEFTATRKMVVIE